MIEDVILISAWCWGVYCIFNPDDNYILSAVGRFLERIFGTWACKPLFLCPPCMGSVHGLSWGLYFYGFDFKIIPFVICLTGINYAIKAIIFPEYEDTSP